MDVKFARYHDEAQAEGLVRPGAFAQDADRMLFIFVEMRPRPLDVSVESGTYRLADDGELGCHLRLQWRVIDAAAFWNGSTDPVATLRDKVVYTARQYFSKLTTQALEERAGVELDLADSIFDRSITIIQNGVEAQVSQNAAVPGALIDAVSAVIKPSPLLTEHLRRLREQFYGQGGLIERSKVDRLLERDQTYAPYKVREVARSLDMRLLENFYTRSWGEAMAELAKAFEAKKAEHQPMDDRLTSIADLLKRAEQAKLDEEHILTLKDMYAAALVESVERPDTRSAITDQAFLEAVLGPPWPRTQVGFDASSAKDENDPE